MLDLLHFNKNERRKWTIKLITQQSYPHQACKPSCWVLKASWSVSKVLASTSISIGVWTIATCSSIRREMPFCLLARFSSISENELWSCSLCIPSCSNSFFSVFCLASRVTKLLFNDWWCIASTLSKFKASTIWDAIVAKCLLYTSSDIFVDLTCRTTSRWSTPTMYFSIWDFSGEGSTPIFTIALRSSSIFPFSNGRHSLEVLRTISLILSPIIHVIWRCTSRTICSTSNVWAKLRGATRKVSGHGDFCLTIKLAMVKSVNSLYVVFSNVAS